MSVSEKGLLFNSVRKFPSPEMLNIKCWIVGTGDQINAIPSAQLEDGMACSVTEDASDLSLRRGVAYLRVLGVWVSINAGTHTHTSSNDGGKLTYVLERGMYDVWIINRTNPEPFKNINTSTNGTALMNSSGYLELTASSGTANNVVNCYERGLTYTFSQPLSVFARLKLTDVATSLMTRFGFNGDTAETGSPGNQAQMIVEGCDTCSTDKVSIVSGDGTQRLKDPTSITDLLTDLANYLLELRPTLGTILYKRNNSTIVIKDEAIPSTGTADKTKLIIAGIQTKNTTAKKMQVHGFIANGTIGESAWNNWNES